MADEEQKQAQQFEINGTHRLPTLSASEALRKARSDPRAIPTGLAQLDSQLQSRSLSKGSSVPGLPLGQVTEVYGPPGSGKTSFGLQLCASVARKGGRSIWIDTASPLALERSDAFTADAGGDAQSPHREGTQVQSKAMQHFMAPTLPHLLALLLHGLPASPRDNIRLIVVDTISTPFERAYARDDRNSNASEASKWASGRKFAVMGELVRKFGKLAIMFDLAVVLLCQCATKLRTGAPAILLPSISGRDWETGISTRILLYRDWSPPKRQPTPGDGDLSSCHFAAVSKAGGSQVNGYTTPAVPFTISANALSELPNNDVPHVSPTPCSPSRPAKRTYVEIADSDAEDLDSDDDYGWMDEDEGAAGNGETGGHPPAQPLKPTEPGD